VGEFLFECEFPAKCVNVRCAGGPVFPVEYSDSVCFEFVFVVKKAVADEIDGVCGVCEFLEEPGCGH